jgi:hypothetical protein
MTQMPDGVSNPVRNVSALKRYGRGCKPRPAQKPRRLTFRWIYNDLRGIGLPAGLVYNVMGIGFP